MAYAIREDRSIADDGDADQVDALIQIACEPDGDSATKSFEELYHHYKPTLVRYARRRGAVDPDGVANLALFDGYQALGSMRRPNRYTFRSYLFQAVRTHVIKEHRRTNPSPTVIDEEKVKPSLGFEADLVGSIAFDEMVGQLPVDQREVVKHRFLDGLSAKETGRLLGKEPNAVYQLQHRAVKRLHRMILAGAALAIAAAIAVVLTQQSERQLIDSSPARPTETVERDVSQTTTTDVTVEDTERSAPKVTEDAATDTREDGGQSIRATKPAEGQGVEESDTNTAVAVAPSITEPADPDVEPTTVTTIPPSPEPAESAEQEAPIEEPTVPADVVVIVTDDQVRATVGEPVNYNVMLNDGPTSNLGTVTLMSGRAEGLSLGADGLLTGIPEKVGSFILVYRVTGLNGNSDFGQVLITVS